jgi:hypothetical protein
MRSGTKRATMRSAIWPDLLRIELRPNDGVARYGGEEFVILLPGAGISSDAQSTVSRCSANSPSCVHA